LWQIELIETDEELKIIEIQLAGLVVQQSPFLPLPATDLICRGHISLYETFYPFCAEILAGANIQSALKKAGFRS
jgi:hypothetical protein